MENEKEKLQIVFINEVHNIAKHCLEMLDEILTDEVLIWCLTDIDKKLSSTIDICLGLENIFNSPNGDSSIKDSSQTLFNNNKDRLKEYYDLFLIYDNIRKKRNIFLYFTPTIDKSTQELQHILGQDAKNRPVIR